MGWVAAQKGQISEVDAVTGARVVAKLGPESEQPPISVHILVQGCPFLCQEAGRAASSGKVFCSFDPWGRHALSHIGVNAKRHAVGMQMQE